MKVFREMHTKEGRYQVSLAEEDYVIANLEFKRVKII